MEHALSSRRLRPSRRLRSIGSLLAELRRSGRLRLRTLLIALVAVALLAGGFLWFRDSPLVSVQQVRITGVGGPDAAAIERALRSRAQGMSTMDFSAGSLQEAVSSLHLVRALRVSVSFPHTMSIAVAEQLPVATLSAGGASAAVAADGVVLGTGLRTGTLPSVATTSLPSPGEAVSDPRLRAYLTVLGAAPAPLLPLVSRLYVGAQGLTVQMRNGLLAYFGDASRPHAKWDSLVTVLSDSGSAGATYVDVRLPERPAAGMPAGSATTSTSEAAQVSASDPTSAALAASLAKAVAGESPIEASPSHAQGAAEAASGTGGEEEPAEVTAPEAAAEGAG